MVIFVDIYNHYYLTFNGGYNIMNMQPLLKGECIMPTIVQHYDKKTGKTRVYESTPHYDPVTKQSRPKRKYLGTLDPETGELIPSSGRRGRTASSKNNTTTTEVSATKEIAVLQKTISEKDEEIIALQNEVKMLKATIRSYEKVCASISNALGKVPCDL